MGIAWDFSRVPSDFPWFPGDPPPPASRPRGEAFDDLSDMESGRDDGLVEIGGVAGFVEPARDAPVECTMGVEQDLVGEGWAGWVVCGWRHRHQPRVLDPSLFFLLFISAMQRQFGASVGGEGLHCTHTSILSSGT